MAVNVVQVGSQAVNLGAGNVGAGTLRLCICNDDVNFSAANESLSTIAENTSNLTFDTASVVTAIETLESKIDTLITAIGSVNTSLSSIDAILTDVHISASNRLRVLAQAL